MKECPWHWERGTYLPWNCNHILKNKPGRQLANHSLPPNPGCFSIPLRAGGYNKVRGGDFGQESHPKPARTGSRGSFSCVWSAYRSPLCITIKPKSKADMTASLQSLRQYRSLTMFFFLEGGVGREKAFQLSKGRDTVQAWKEG